MDKHYNFVQKLVGNKFKDSYGLKSTLILHKSTRVPMTCKRTSYRDFSLQNKSLDHCFHNP